MSTSSEASSADRARPSKTERHQARREQIITAARHCVIRNGFHAASTAQIAAAANMSVGQMYRYFPSKDAIIQAIVEQIATFRLQGFLDVDADPNLAATLTDKLIDALAQHREDQLLMLEITAEATRNPLAARTIKQADDLLKQRVIAAFRHANPGLSQEEAASRVELLAALVEGTVMRRLGGLLQTQLAPKLYRSVINQLLTGVS